MSQRTNSKPVKDFRAGTTIQASIWRDDSKKDGRTVTKYSVRIQKRFRKENGSYENTDYFFPDDLPRLALLAQKAFEYIALSESKDTEVPV
jgi:hypothetical protein